MKESDLSICGKKLSVVLPAFNEEENIINTAQKLKELFRNSGIEYELIFVNDGSDDNTWENICKVRKTDDGVKGVCFSRNFGKEAAIYAGLVYASGDAVVVMDCDLQHPPETVLKMYELWAQGYEIVEGVKVNRGRESKIHEIAANTFYLILSKAMRVNLKNTSDFKLMDRKVVEAVLSLRESNGFFRAIASWVGFRTTTICFEVQERVSGKSKWSMLSLFKYAINNITSYTSIPLQIPIFTGIAALTGSIFLMVLFIKGHIRKASNIKKELLKLYSLQLCLGGNILMGVGILGYYLSKTYDEVRKRPRYIVSKTV